MDVNAGADGAFHKNAETQNVSEFRARVGVAARCSKQQLSTAQRHACLFPHMHEQKRQSGAVWEQAPLWKCPAAESPAAGKRVNPVGKAAFWWCGCLLSKPITAYREEGMPWNP